MKTLQNLKDKYNNEKKNAKARMSANKKEMMKTGGGSAQVVNIEDDFGFSVKQINGLTNKFDSDAPEEQIFEVIEETLNDEIMSDTESFRKRRLSPTVPTPLKYSSKKMKLSEAKEMFMKSKTESITLDNKYKQLLIEKTELEKIKLGLEIQKLEKELVL